jgi:hypothetical protein
MELDRMSWLGLMSTGAPLVAHGPAIAAFKDLMMGLQALATAVSILVIGIWVLFRFRRQKERFAHVQSSAEIKIIGRQADAWIAEIVAVIENKAKVGYEISALTFDLKALNLADPAKPSAMFGGQVEFCRSVAQGSFLTETIKTCFVAPGVVCRYSWLARVPIEARMLNLHCAMSCADKNLSRHTMETTIALPDSATPVVAAAATSVLSTALAPPP